MLPNFTVVICGAILTVLMLAVAGSGLIDPQTRTRVGAMPEVGRPMMQRMIAEPAARFAALEASRRAEELMRLRDLAPAIAVPAPAEHDAPAQPGEAAVAPAQQPSLPSDVVAAPAASTEAAAAVAETVPAPAAEEIPPAAAEGAPAPGIVVEAAPVAEAPPAAIAEALPPPVAEQARAPDTAGAQTPDASKLAGPGAESERAAPLALPPVAAPEQVAATPSFEASSSEPTATAAQSEPPAEPPAAALQQLALADPDAVPDPEPPAKLAARTGEPEEAAPVRRVVPHFLVRLMARLPRVIPSHTRASAPRLAPALPRMASVRHVHPRARAEASKAAVAPKKPVRHMVRPVRRAQRAWLAPDSVAYPSYGVTSGVQYR